VGIFIGGEALAQLLNPTSSGLSLFQPCALILAINQIIFAAIFIELLTISSSFSGTVVEARGNVSSSFLVR
jgi:hypothetical protein